MHDIVHTTLEIIRHHSEWAFPVLFIVSFGESFVGLSLLFPGTTIMVLAGTLVRSPFNPHGALEFWPLLFGAVLGAVLGDAISFWIGRRFDHVVERHWFFVRHPDVLPRGYAYFDKYGIASVFVGRFFGPVRAVIPLVAGIMEMSWRQFWFANIASAFIWAPALLFAGTALRAVLARLTPHGWHLVLSVAAVVSLTAAVWALRKHGYFDRFVRR
jgi:membrane protein DedA with SNARE-associated domain